MDELLLWVNLQESDKVAMWLVRYPQIADQVTDALITLNTIQGATLVFNLMAGRDAAHALYMTAFESGFEHMAAVFSAWYDQFCRALVHYWKKMHAMSEYE